MMEYITHLLYYLNCGHGTNPQEPNDGSQWKSN